MLKKETRSINQPLVLTDRYPVDAKYIAENMENLLYSPGHYDGIQKHVQYDESITATLQTDNPTWTLQEAVEANPTGKVYKLRPLVLCNCDIKDHGTLLAHWEKMTNTDLKSISGYGPNKTLTTDAQGNFLWVPTPAPAA